VECTSTGGRSDDVAGPKEARKASSRAVSWATWLGTGGGSGRKATDDDRLRLRFIDDVESDDADDAEEEVVALDDDAEAGALRGMRNGWASLPCVSLRSTFFDSSVWVVMAEVSKKRHDTRHTTHDTRHTTHDTRHTTPEAVVTHSLFELFLHPGLAMGLALLLGHEELLAAHHRLRFDLRHCVVQAPARE
jgi:hypothetical protein